MSQAKPFCREVSPEEPAGLDQTGRRPRSALAHDPDDSQLKLESGNFMRFQADTGAQCNVRGIQKAAKDPHLKRITKTTAKIVAYGGSTLPVVGKIILKRKSKAPYRL